MYNEGMNETASSAMGDQNASKPAHTNTYMPTPTHDVQVARCLMSTRETFVDLRDASHLRWMKDCREVGDVVRLLVGALDDDNLEGVDLIRFGIHLDSKGRKTKLRQQ